MMKTLKCISPDWTVIEEDWGFGLNEGYNFVGGGSSNIFDITTPRDRLSG